MGRAVLDWKPVIDCDDEDGNHTCWSTEINHPKYGKYAWIEETWDGYGISTSNYEDSYLKICKSLVGAKRWASLNFKQQTERVDSMKQIKECKDERKAKAETTEEENSCS